MDLSRFGSYLLMALVGIVIGSIVNIFLASGPLHWALTYLGIFVRRRFAWRAMARTRKAFGHHPQLWRAWSGRGSTGHSHGAPGASTAIAGRTVGGYLLVPRR